MHGYIQKIPDVIASNQGEAWLRSEITKLIPLP
jgi:hypothetical protein